MKKVKLNYDQKLVLFLDGNRGIYIPRQFAQCVLRDSVTGISQEDYDILLVGPDHEWYWETWDSVLSEAVLKDELGKWTLYQDGDLWLVHSSFTQKDWDTFAG